MAALKDKFLEAEGFLSANKIQMAEALKLKLYGLSKQIKEGDCKMPQPPSSNTILRAKWENWMNYSGWPIDKAMNEYVNMVELLKEGTPGGKSNDAPGSIRKSGVLYKQRDVFKGWRARHFSLQDNFLHYSLEADDPVPRDTMDLTGCSVTTSKSVIVDGVEYYPFVITHPKSTKTYNLSSTSKLETDVWVSKILDAASTPIAAPVPQGKVERLLERREPDHDEAAHEDVTSNKNLNNSVLTLANIPKKFSAKLELAMQAMLDAVAPDAQGWEQLFEKNGVKAMKRSGDVICVRGESVMPYCVLDVFEMIMSVERQVEIDPQQRLHEVIRKYSNHTWAEYILFKGVWPTSPRDFTNLIHWRQMTDGTIIIAGFSEKFEDLRPIPDGNVRGELILGGYVIRQHPQGTQVYFVVQTDLKGTLPSSVVNIVSSGQPMIVANIRRLIEQDKKKNGPGRKIDTPTTYQELLAISIKGGGNKPDDVVEISNEDSTKGNSKQVSASQIDRSKVAAAAKAEAAPAAPAAPVKKPKKKAAQENKLNTIALLVLLLPPLLYYAVDRKFRAVAFVGGLLIAYQYLVKLHLGNPVKRPTVPDCTVLPVGRYNFRFPVDLGRLLKFLDSKRNELEMEITLTHVAVKATAMVLFEQTHLKGHVICGDFYLARQPGVDLTVNYEVTATETTVLRIDDADAKPLEYITDEITTKGQAVRAMKSKPGAAAAAAKAAGNYRPQLLAVLPPAISRRVDKFLTYLGSQLGVSVPALGVERFPLGLCTVLTSPNQEGEQDMDIMVVPSIADSATPITVTIGGIRLLPAMDQERKLIGSPSLNFSVSVDSKACSLSDARKFAARLQQFMNEPDLIDKADQNAARLRDDTSKRKSMFG